MRFWVSKSSAGWGFMGGWEVIEVLRNGERGRIRGLVSWRRYRCV